VNNREEAVKRRYEEQGWKMLRGGAPDFIALRVDDKGNILEFRGVEVKTNGSSLTYEQAIYQRIFELANIPFTVEVEK